MGKQCGSANEIVAISSGSDATAGRITHTEITSRNPSREDSSRRNLRVTPQMSAPTPTLSRSASSNEVSAPSSIHHDTPIGNNNESPKIRTTSPRTFRTGRIRPIVLPAAALVERSQSLVRIFG